MVGPLRQPILAERAGDADRDTADCAAVLPDGYRLAVCDVNPGFERPTQVLNLRAGPLAQVQAGQRTVVMTAPRASEQELDLSWRELTRIWLAAWPTTEAAGGRCSCSSRTSSRGA